ncbi:dirigent protein 24-like [Cucurbita moschata]|uniref:Dirigent protein n=1 Tax=Cucurbita moschata TaxID=3662 RepID=A0A6J1GSZ8_CUCMO|nr:dirigent protein 24-like [Cucurbita moschata]
MAKLPLSLFLFLTALSSADSATILHLSAPQPPTPTLSFFMHDIMGGSHPSARTVTGATPKSKAAEPSSGLPFSKPKNNIFPIPGGVPLITTDKKPEFVVFGSLTAIDDEVTDGEELGSAIVGRAQGFYFVSSLDGSSHTVAFTVIVRRHNDGDNNDDEDTISFFGVHRRGSPESPIAVVGGTGKYEKAGGFAVIENLRRRESQHLTDGVDTIVHVSVYLSN